MGSSRAIHAESDRGPVGFAAVLRVRTFAVLFAAETQSIVGDQFARVALSVLVYEWTGSAAATAAVYATTFFPSLFGGAVLARLGDRYAPRLVMVSCDMVRAGCFAVMAVRSVPLGVTVGLLVVAVAVGPVFAATEVGVLADELGREQLRCASALRLTTSQIAQVLGFAVGGILVASLGPFHVLVLDALTYLASAALVGLLLPAAAHVGKIGGAEPSVVPAAQTVRAANPLWADRRIRSNVALSCLIGFFVVPEALAVPYTAGLGASTTQFGLLLASGALGGAVGAALLVRAFRPDRRGEIARWMAVGCGLPLVVSGLMPSVATAAACWFLSGVFAAYVVETSSTVVEAVPESRRSHLIGTYGALVLTAQGAGLAGFGAVAAVLAAPHAIALAGAIGSVCALLLAIGPRRAASL